ncbi:MAG: ABC transporter substrate-binding protein [Fibrobacterota bacterium]
MVSVLPSITEIICALGREELLVGVSDFCKYPPLAVNGKTKVGGCLNPGLENIMRLRPDVVFLGEMQSSAAKKLGDLRIKTVSVSQNNIEEIYSSIKTIGIELGAEKEADSLISLMRDTLNSGSSESTKKKVLFVVGRNPGTLQNVFTVGKSSFLYELIEKAGGKPLFGNMKGNYPKISVEEIIRRSPDIIIETSGMEQAPGQKKTWERLEGVPAVKSGNVFFVNKKFITIPGPRITKTFHILRSIIINAES